LDTLASGKPALPSPRGYERSGRAHGRCRVLAHASEVVLDASASDKPALPCPRALREHGCLPCEDACRVPLHASAFRTPSTRNGEHYRADHARGRVLLTARAWISFCPTLISATERSRSHRALW